MNNRNDISKEISEGIQVEIKKHRKS